MFNFRPKMEKKISDSPLIEERPYIEDNEQNKEKSLTTEKIKGIYERGRLFILATIISLGMFPAKKSGEESFYNTFTHSFKNIPSEKSQKIFDDFNKILSPEEFSKFIENDYDTLLPNLILDDKVRETFVKLSKIFTIEHDDIDDNFDEKKEENEQKEKLLKINDKEVWEKIIEIDDEFPSDFQPKISSIPYKNIEFLNDPIYLNGIKRMASLKMTDYIAYCDSESVKKVATDDKLFNLLKKLNSFGPNFTASIIDRLVVTGPKPEGCPEERWQERLNFRNDFEKFLESNPNTKFLKYADGSEIYSDMIIDLIDDSSGKYTKFFEDKNNQKSIEYLYSIGYNFESMFYLIRGNYENMINEPAFLDVLTELSQVNIRCDEYNVWFQFLAKYDSYYNLYTKEGFEDLAHDLKRAKHKLGDSAGNFFKLRDKFLEIKKNHIENSNESIKENVFEPLVAGVDASNKNWDEFLKDPAMDIITKLKYQNNLPKYLDTFEYYSKIDWMMRVARNMYIANTPITPENFEKTFHETVSIRMDKELINKSLFKNRNVALFAHNERYGDNKKVKLTNYILMNKGKNRFGKPAALDAISKQQPENLNMFRANNTTESLINTKKLFLEYIINHSNLTVVIDAHGTENAIYFTNGLPKNQELKNSTKEEVSDCVTFEEIADAIEQRYDKNIKDVPIFIMTSCYNQDFIRNLCEKIIEINLQNKKDILLPIVSGDAEYGQYAYSTKSELGNDFFDLILKNKSNSKIKDILQIENGTGITNVSLFVPFNKESKDNNNKKTIQKIFYQITQNGGTTLNKTLALQYAEDLINNKLDEKTASYWEYTNPGLASKIKEIINENKHTNIETIG